MPSGLWKTIFAQRASSRSHLCARERQTALASTEPRFGPCLAGRTMATAKVMAALTGLSLVWCKRFPQATPLAWDAILGRTLLAPRRPFSASPLRGLLPRCVRVALGPPCQAGCLARPLALPGLCPRRGAFGPFLLSTESLSPRRGVELALSLVLAIGTWVERTSYQVSAWDGGLNLPGRAQRLQQNHPPVRRPVRKARLSLCAAETVCLAVGPQGLARATSGSSFFFFHVVK